VNNSVAAVLSPVVAVKPKPKLIDPPVSQLPEVYVTELPALKELPIEVVVPFVVALVYPAWLSSPGGS
jgi:hypothetical protein